MTTHAPRKRSWFRSSRRSFPPYHLLEDHAEDRIEGEARRKLDKLERLYHVGQDKAWDGKELLASLIKKHGPPRFAPETKEAALKVLSVLLWGELAAWAISADLAERIDDIEAKMAATSQAHDEARHFYVLRDYLAACGETVPRMGGVGRTLLTTILNSDSLVHKLTGMQLLVETNAQGIFRGIEGAAIEPVLTELLPYYQKDEARHVALGVLYLPRLLGAMSAFETGRLVAFQLRCIALLVAAFFPLDPHFRALGVDHRRIALHTLRIQDDIFREMRQSGGAGPESAPRGLVDPSRGLGPRIVNFLMPEGGAASMSPGHHTAFTVLDRIAHRMDRALA